MADLLTHVLFPYVCLTVAGWIVTVPRRWIPIAMGGAAVPDLVKIDLVVSADTVSTLLGSPFSYAPISSVTGVVLISGIIALNFGTEDRTTAYGLLVFGGFSSLVLDGLRAFADGSAGYWLYPLWVRPPTPSLYVTADSRVLLTTLVVSLSVAVLDAKWVDSDGERSDG